MSFFNCPRCGLSVHAHADQPSPTICPRCAGRAGLTVPMYETNRPRPPVTAPQTDTRDGAIRVRRSTPQTA